jgi:hypothetical protein
LRKGHALLFATTSWSWKASREVFLHQDNKAL